MHYDILLQTVKVNASIRRKLQTEHAGLERVRRDNVIRKFLTTTLHVHRCAHPRHGAHNKRNAARKQRQHVQKVRMKLACPLIYGMRARHCWNEKSVHISFKIVNPGSVLRNGQITNDIGNRDIDAVAIATATQRY